ncbi:hypothetical protein IFM89_037490 [Coptis chinensis]|uniref:Mitochondrial processing peptidase n=1 Tax=Coptis chinensis TaxID=261450 RepID=A0A835I8C9_9MAGN|nr:hypothetical protein IFM89_037490 [Coptis chinensis]
MAIRNLLTLVRKSKNRFLPSPRSIIQPYFFSSSSSLTQTETKPPLAPPHPHEMIYDRLAEQVKSKLKKLDNPDSRFLQHASPHPVLTDHTQILSAPETRVTTLPNGLRVATESNLAVKTATVGVWIDAGSRFETDETSGTAHFLEHMIFKGTGKRSARALEEEIENMGGHLNAYTSREQTTYYANVLGENVPIALDILADILQNSEFDSDRVDRGNPTQEVVFDHLHATAFQYLLWAEPFWALLRISRKITRADIGKYISTHYAFPRMVRIIDDDVPLAQFAVAFEGASWTDPDSIALMVMQSMLGSWNKSTGGGKHMGSELAQRVGINEIAESMMAFNTNYKDTGLFGVYAVAKLKSSLLLHIDGTSPVAEDIGRQVTFFYFFFFFDSNFFIIDMDNSDVIQMWAIAAMGPIQSLPDYNWFRRRTYLLFVIRLFNACCNHPSISI